MLPLVVPLVDPLPLVAPLPLVLLVGPVVVLPLVELLVVVTPPAQDLVGTQLWVAAPLVGSWSTVATQVVLGGQSLGTAPPTG